MKIKLKFSIDEVVYFYDQGKLIRSRVKSIRISVDKNGIKKFYNIYDTTRYFIEKELFKTSNDFFNELLKYKLL